MPDQPANQRLLAIMTEDQVRRWKAMTGTADAALQHCRGAFGGGQGCDPLYIGVRERGDGERRHLRFGLRSAGRNSGQAQAEVEVRRRRQGPVARRCPAEGAVVAPAAAPPVHPVRGRCWVLRVE
jgi:hypothetical protein